MIASSFFCEIEYYVTHEKWRKEPNTIEYRQYDPCAYCGLPGESWDHIDSVRICPGKRKPSNIVRACKKCNTAKKSMKLIQFLVLTRYTNLLDERGISKFSYATPRWVFLRDLLRLLQALV